LFIANPLKGKEGGRETNFDEVHRVSRSISLEIKVRLWNKYFGKRRNHIEADHKVL
jgi:hypothetical protein